MAYLSVDRNSAQPDFFGADVFIFDDLGNEKTQSLKKDRVLLFGDGDFYKITSLLVHSRSFKRTEPSRTILTMFHLLEDETAGSA